MSKRVDTEHAEARALEDAAWSLKSAAEMFHCRAMTAESARVLTSERRDVERVMASVQAEWNRRVESRKRGPAEGAPLFDDVQAPAGVDHG